MHAYCKCLHVSTPVCCKELMQGQTGTVASWGAVGLWEANTCIAADISCKGFDCRMACHILRTGCCQYCQHTVCRKGAMAEEQLPKHHTEAKETPQGLLCDKTGHMIMIQAHLGKCWRL
jgi:hypothetical protein